MFVGRRRSEPTHILPTAEESEVLIWQPSHRKMWRQQGLHYKIEALSQFVFPLFLAYSVLASLGRRFGEKIQGPSLRTFSFKMSREGDEEKGHADRQTLTLSAPLLARSPVLNPVCLAVQSDSTRQDHLLKQLRKQGVVNLH